MMRAAHDLKFEDFSTAFTSCLLCYVTSKQRFNIIGIYSFQVNIFLSNFVFISTIFSKIKNFFTVFLKLQSVVTDDRLLLRYFYNINKI